MNSTKYFFQPTPNWYNDHYTSYASEDLAPYDFWTSGIQKNFTPQMNFLRPSIFD